MNHAPEQDHSRNHDSLPSEAELEPLVRFALAQAKSQGAGSAEARVGVSRGLTIKVRKGHVDTLQQERDQSFTVSVYVGHRTGSASCNQFDRSAIQAAVDAACAIARATSPDPFQGLADADLMAKDPLDLDLYHPWQLEPKAAIEIAKSCEAAALAHDSRLINSDGASITTGSAIRCYGNSHGFLAATRGTRHSLSCVMVAGDTQGMQRDHWYSATRDAKDLESPEAVGVEAGRRTVARLGSVPVNTVTAPILFEAPVARSLIGHLLAAVSGGNLYRKSSFLLDTLNLPVCAHHVQIQEQPHLRGAPGSAAFDPEGVATRNRDLVRNGVLQTYLLGSYAARKLDMCSTGHAGGAHNVMVRSDNSMDFEAMLKCMGTGLLVTELMGQGINLVTGDYSRGAAGFWIHDGEIQHPVSGVTIAGNLKDMLTGIEAIGDDVDRRGNIQTGAILVGKMIIAGA